MEILITNDDGWGSKGILTLVEAMQELGHVTVVAPMGARSGQSSAITVRQPMWLHQVSETPESTVYTCSGTPADCVKMAINIVYKGQLPDLVVSGINHGDNGTINVVYSGTMGATFVGCEQGIPSIGFSLCDHDPNTDFSYMRPYLTELVRTLMPMTKPYQRICWNVNAPVGPIKGWRYGRQTNGYWTKEMAAYTDPTGQPFYMLQGEFVDVEPKSWAQQLEEDEFPTDHALNSAGYISVCPTTIDMTAYEILRQVR